MNETKTLNIEIIDILKISRNSPKTIVTQNKFCHVLSCRTNGKCVFESNGKSFVAEKGDVVFIPSASNYSQNSSKESLICFHLSTKENIASEIQFLPQENTEYICGLFKKAESIWRKKEKNYKYLCLAILYEIIGITDAIITPKPKDFDILSPCVDYINTHMFEADFNLGNAFGGIGISRAYFNRLFKLRFNTTPVSYINSKKINRAKQLLASGGYTNEEIAATCGFNEIEYFYLTFKKLTGMTTKEYKKAKEKN